MRLAYLTVAALALAFVSTPTTGALAAGKQKAAKPAKVEYLRAAVATPTPAATTKTSRKAK